MSRFPPHPVGTELGSTRVPHKMRKSETSDLRADSASPTRGEGKDPMTTPFVSAEWLAERLDDPTVAIIDGSWYLPAMNRDPEAEYRAGHIPGAIRFDIDTVK